MTQGLEIPKTFFSSFQSPNPRSLLEKNGVENCFSVVEEEEIMCNPPTVKSKIVFNVNLITSAMLFV